MQLLAWSTAYPSSVWQTLDNAEEVVFIPGQNSLWRDIKTWGDYAYVTTDQSGTTEGLLVIDLSQLPEAAPDHNWNPDLPELGVLNTCHNLYIDEFGYCYLSGCNVNDGGVLFLDADHTRYADLINKCVARYSHDSYARNNILYSSEILGGTLGIYDVSRKQIPFCWLLRPRRTPSHTMHGSLTMAMLSSQRTNVRMRQLRLTTFRI